MKCPIDQSDLLMTDRQGIEVDYCPKCRGVWLDRGELDKIIERSAAAEAPRAQMVRDPGPDPRGLRQNRRRDNDDDDDWGGGRRGPGGFLSDFFDF
jgi:Zn-finger nucleic acid-binding protein